MAGKRSRGPVVLVVLALAGCSSVPDAVNPVEWYRSASDMFSARSPSQPSASDAKMAEAQSKSTPNLASVPPRPTRASTPSERQTLTQGLVSDRENAKYTDDDLQPRAAAPATSASSRTAPPAAAASPPPPPPPTPTRAGSVIQPAAPTAPAPAAAAPAAAASSDTAQPVPPPPPPTMPQVASTPAPARTPSRPAAAAPPPAPPPPPPAAAMAAPPPPAAAPPRAAAPAAPRATPPAASVDQIYRQQLARSESVVQLRQPVAEAPPPPPAQPRRIGALQHTAREPARQQAMYVGGPTGIAPPAIRAGEPVAAIRFGEGSARLANADRETLARIAAMAREIRGLVRIVGHVGRPGGEGAKQEMADFGLSLDRANAVAQELMKNGIAAERLKVEAVGDAEPLVIAGSAAAEAANRRAEIFIE